MRNNVSLLIFDFLTWQRNYFLLVIWYGGPFTKTSFLHIPTYLISAMHFDSNSVTISRDTWRALFQNSISAIAPQKYIYNRLAMPIATFIDCVLENSFSTYVNFIYIFMKSSFPKTWSSNLALTLQIWSLDCRLSRFGKELFTYIYIYHVSLIKWVPQLCCN